MTLEILLELFKVLGVTGGLLAYFIWRDYHRDKRNNEKEDALILRINNIEDYQKHKLERLTLASNAALQATAEAQRELVIALSKKPCMADEILRIQDAN